MCTPTAMVVGVMMSEIRMLHLSKSAARTRGLLGVKAQVQLEHIDAGFSQYAEKAALRVNIHELLEMHSRNPPRICDTRDLKRGGCRCYVGSKATCRCGYEIDGDKARRILGFQFFCLFGYPVDQRFRRRSRVRSRRVAGVIGGGYRFCCIARVGIGRGGGPGMEIASVCEVLADKLRTEGLSLALD